RSLRLVAADALALPFAPAVFDAVTVAFGVRNFGDRGAAFAEAARVLKPQGRLVILEFSPAPRGLLGACRRCYCGFVLPRVAALFSRSAAAYRYLPASVDRFPRPAELLAELERAGLRPVALKSLALGVVALWCARKDGVLR
ncbi:MAG: class I SAM-dependent methyltransferase, partial [Planctomycetes bacterium]|nr:class I SAM-dependent methyltransferase [Planctomycetota bacterium]